MVSSADPGGSDEHLPPFELTARSLDRSILDAQLERLNPRDRRLAAEALGLAPAGTDPPSSTPPLDAVERAELQEQALAKLRHPAVARAWRHQPRPSRG